MSCSKHVVLDYRVGVLGQKRLNRRSLGGRRGLPDGVGVRVIFSGVFDGDLTRLSGWAYTIDTLPGKIVAKANKEASTDFFMQRS